MALSISTQSSLNALVPPPSQDFAVLQQQPVPDVFVIPPEEEQEDNPPWCYFDATQAAKESLITYPDIDALDVALGICQQTDNRAPSFNRYHSNESHETIVMPRRGNAIPRLRDMDLAFEDGQTDIRSRGGSTRSRDHRPFDEEIVEVVKVRRNEGMTDVGDGRTLKMKKSSTFRARATQALRSIKNVGKSSSSNRRATVSISEPKAKLPIHAQGAGGATLPSRHSCQDPPTPRAASPTVSRRRSLTLSQMFAFKEKENQTSRPASPMEAEPPSPITPSCEPAPASRPMSPTDNSSSHARRLQPSPSLEDCMATPTRSHSPNGDDPVKPSLSKRKSFRRRLSVLELQKLFSIGTHSQPNSAPVQDADEDLFSPSQSRPLSMDSTAILSSTSSRTSSVSLGEMSARRPSASSQRSSSRAGGDCSNIDEEDLEMRLDSLHFDSLHFDPDEIMSTL
ncbi:hypothetical protein C8Q70DRAFT_1049233 [Cubamyces menziesii]|uniref:Uncharacterized protein n=1 Tax=Trametes cubensis TaxID=1111947 RepID=A0AAD7X9D0_9APHY|nr:hypothetical protein C8Q70DRAFT_1049233 [Cubamyces menziesii]KAJ8482275.1 hypothetical protein ONZ51_g5463 [Trametes cubensis]